MWEEPYGETCGEEVLLWRSQLGLGVVWQEMGIQRKSLLTAKYLVFIFSHRT